MKYTIKKDRYTDTFYHVPDDRKTFDYIKEIKGYYGSSFELYDKEKKQFVQFKTLKEAKEYD